MDPCDEILYDEVIISPKLEEEAYIPVCGDVQHSLSENVISRRERNPRAVIVLRTYVVLKEVVARKAQGNGVMSQKNLVANESVSRRLIQMETVRARNKCY